MTPAGLARPVPIPALPAVVAAIAVAAVPAITPGAHIAALHNNGGVTVAPAIPSAVGFGLGGGGREERAGQDRGCHDAFQTHHGSVSFSDLVS